MLVLKRGSWVPALPLVRLCVCVRVLEAKVECSHVHLAGSAIATFTMCVARIICLLAMAWLAMVCGSQVCSSFRIIPYWCFKRMHRALCQAASPACWRVAQHWHCVYREVLYVSLLVCP